MKRREFIKMGIYFILIVPVISILSKIRAHRRELLHSKKYSREAMYYKDLAG